MSLYQGPGQSGTFSIRYNVSLYEGTWYDTDTPGGPGTKITVSYLGLTVSMMIPDKLLPNPAITKIVVLAGSRTELTDVAPNSAAISLIPGD